MKKILMVMTLMIGLLMTSAMVFADETNGDHVVGGDEKVEKVERIAREDLSQEELEALKAERKVSFEGLLEKYTPDLLDDWTSSYVEHESVHSEIDSVKAIIRENFELVKESYRAEFSSFMENIKAQIASEEINREEGKEAIETFKLEMKTIREAMRLEHEADRELLKAINDKIKALGGETKLLKEALRNAVQDEQVETIIANLKAIVANHQQHLVYDYEKLNHFNNILSDD